MATAAERKRNERRRQQVKGWTQVSLVLPANKAEAYRAMAQADREQYRRQLAAEQEMAPT